MMQRRDGGRGGGRGQGLDVTGLDVCVHHIAADHHVADLPLGSDGRAQGPTVGLKILDERRVDNDVVHAAAEEDVPRARRAKRMTLLVSPPMKKLLISEEVEASTGEPLTSLWMAKAVKFVALPPIRILPIAPPRPPSATT